RPAIGHDLPRPGRSEVSVNLAAVADLQDEHQQTVVLHAIRDSPVADPDAQCARMADERGRSYRSRLGFMPLSPAMTLPVALPSPFPARPAPPRRRRKAGPPTGASQP